MDRAWSVESGSVRIVFLGLPGGFGGKWCRVMELELGVLAVQIGSPDDWLEVSDQPSADVTPAGDPPDACERVMPRPGG